MGVLMFAAGSELRKPSLLDEAAGREFDALVMNRDGDSAEIIFFWCPAPRPERFNNPAFRSLHRRPASEESCLRFRRAGHRRSGLAAASDALESARGRSIARVRDLLIAPGEVHSSTA